MVDSLDACLSRARANLEAAQPHLLRYVALDLRLVMETLTYEKLKQAAHVIPPEVQNVWQAPQAVKALLEYNEYAAKSFELSVSDAPLPPDGNYEGIEWHSVGTHKALELAWLRKHYNKVGHYLHARQVGESLYLPIEEVSKYLREVLGELEEALQSGIRSALFLPDTLSFPCEGCGKTVIRSYQALVQGSTAVCSTPACDYEYQLVDKDQRTVEPVLNVLKCVDCSKAFAVPRRKIRLEEVLTCPHCSAKQELVAVRTEWALKLKS